MIEFLLLGMRTLEETRLNALLGRFEAETAAPGHRPPSPFHFAIGHRGPQPAAEGGPASPQREYVRNVGPGSRLLSIVYLRVNKNRQYEQGHFY